MSERSTAIYNERGKFIGHSKEVEHGVGNARAWCFDSHEWCYPTIPCDSCNRSLMGDPWEIIQAVRELHAKHTPDCPPDHLCDKTGTCQQCLTSWPCATIRALDGAS